MKKLKSIFALVLSFVIVISSFSVYQIKANETQDFFLYLAEGIYRTMGSLGMVVTGRLTPENVMELMRDTYEADDAMDQGLTYEEYLRRHFHREDQTNNYVIDEDLYQLILKFINENKNNTNIFQTSVPYKNLRIDRMYWGEKESRKDDYYKTYARSLDAYQAGDKIYPLNHAGNGIDLHNVTIQNLDKPDGKYKYKPKLSIVKNAANDYWNNTLMANANYQNYRRSGIYYYLVPWYLNGRTSAGQKRWQATQWTYGRNNQAQGEIEEPLYTDGYNEIYIVGSFLNPGTTQNYSLKFYQYNRTTDTIADMSYEYKFDFKVNILREQTTGSSKEILDMSVTMGNPRIQSHSAAYLPNNFDKDFTALIGKEFRYVYDSAGDFYYIPLLRSDNPGLYKVFNSLNDLRVYLNQGGTNNVIDNKQTIQSITYNIDDHSITYNYYGDDNDPAYPDGREDTDEEDEEGDQGSNANYEEQLAEIIRELRQIKNKLDDLEPSSSGGDNTEIIGYLIQIRNLLSQLSNSESGANIEAYDDTELLAAIANLQEAIEDIESADYGEILNKIYKALKVNNAENALETLLQLLQMLLDWFADRLEGAEEGAASAAETAVTAVLATKFPFSVPGTMVAVLHLLDATPIAPTITIPLTINYDAVQSGTVSGNSVFGGKHYTSQNKFSESVTFDLADYPESGQITQFFCIIAWCFFLFKMTFKVLSIKIPGGD